MVGFGELKKLALYSGLKNTRKSYMLNNLIE